jgi:hypothetical protein
VLLAEEYPGWWPTGATFARYHLSVAPLADPIEAPAFA